MNTDLLALAREFPDMCITVKLADLLEANAQLVRDVRAEVQRHDERQLSVAEVTEMLGVTRVTPSIAGGKADTLCRNALAAWCDTRPQMWNA